MSYNALRTINKLHTQVVDPQTQLVPLFTQLKLNHKSCRLGYDVVEYTGYASTKKVSSRLHASLSMSAKAKVRRGQVEITTAGAGKTSESISQYHCLLKPKWLKFGLQAHF